jgi:hypothetical protein
MLDSVIIKKIESFVYQKPRSMQEIADHIAKNWRTADRYVQEIETSFGTISTRVFREGTRGALKIVFWSSPEKVSSSIFQEKLEQEILKSRRKEDFSPFDIFQHVREKNKEAYLEKSVSQKEKNLSHYAKLLLGAEKQILLFSGNLSIVNEKGKDFDMFAVFDNLVKRKIPIKVLCRVDFSGRNNVEKLLSLNFKYGKELIEVRHNEQPLRGSIIDMKSVRLKETNIPTLKTNELQKETDIVYFIKDKEWAEWISHIFWKIFSSSIDAKIRLQQIQKLRETR